MKLWRFSKKTRAKSAKSVRKTSKRWTLLRTVLRSPKPKTTIRTKDVEIRLYRTLPTDVKNEAMHLCAGMYADLDAASTADIVFDYLDSSENNIYIMKKYGKMVSFVICRNGLCEDKSCFDCSKSCMYVLLTCVGAASRGQGIFKTFLEELEQRWRAQGVDCVRLTAVNQGVFRLYSKLGFKPEKEDVDATCEYKMIKLL